MAEDADSDVEAEDGEEGAKKKGGLPKLVLFAGAPLALLVIGGLAAVLLMGGGDKDEAQADGDHAGEYAEGDHGEGPKEYGATPPAAEVVFYSLPDFIVNINGDEGRPVYLKLKLTLEVEDPDMPSLLDEAMPRVMDRFQSFLRELRVEDLSGSAGSYRLRLELLRRVNLAVAPYEVRAVLIEEMLIQ